MFLVELKPTQKELFLDLAISLSMSDGYLSDSEKKMIKEMCKEMEIEERETLLYEYKDALVKITENISVREKRIVLLELAGIVLADGVYSDDEMHVMREIADSLNIEYMKFEEAIQIIKELMNVYQKIGNYLTSK